MFTAWYPVKPSKSLAKYRGFGGEEEQTQLTDKKCGNSDNTGRNSRCSPSTTHKILKPLGSGFQVLSSTAFILVLR